MLSCYKKTRLKSMKSYKYYAFISYARKDSTKFAKYIQKELEHYRYPMAGIDDIRKPNDDKFLRKIFLDLNELENSEKTFHEELLNKIENSKYLIILCSLESAKSIWVESEINHFLKTHDNNYNLIVPVLCNGKVPDNIPAPLNRDDILSRNLPSFVEFDGDDKNEAKERGLSQLIAYLLGVERDKVSNRFQMEKRKQQLRVIKTFAMLLILFVGLTCWALFEKNRADLNADEAERNQKQAEHNEQIANINRKKAEDNEQLAVKNQKIAEHNEQIAIKKRKEQQDTLDFYSYMFSSETDDNITVKDFLRLHIKDTDLVDNNYVKVQLKLNMAETLINSRMFGEAKNLLDETYKIIQTLPEELKQYKMADYYKLYGYYIFMANMTHPERDKAIEYYKKALSSNFDAEDKKISVYVDLADIYKLDENYSAAASTLQELYKYLMGIKDRDLKNTMLPTYYMKYRDICYSQHNYKKALEYNKKFISSVLDFTKYDTFYGYGKQVYKNLLSEAYEYNANMNFLLKNYSESYKTAKQVKEQSQDADNIILEYILMASDYKINHKLAQQKDFQTRVENLVNTQVEKVMNDSRKSKEIKEAFLLKAYDTENKNLLFLQNIPSDNIDFIDVNYFDILIREKLYKEAITMATKIISDNGLNPIVKLKVLVKASEASMEFYKLADVNDKRYAANAFMMFLNLYGTTLEDAGNLLENLSDPLDKLNLINYLKEINIKMKNVIAEQKAIIK